MNLQQYLEERLPIKTLHIVWKHSIQVNYLPVEFVISVVRVNGWGYSYKVLVWRSLTPPSKIGKGSGEPQRRAGGGDTRVTRVTSSCRTRPRLIIHEYAVTFSGRGFGRVAEVAETQVLYRGSLGL